MKSTGFIWMGFFALMVLAGLRGVAPVQADNVIVVTTISDVVNENDGQCSLREAVLRANSNSIGLVGECSAGSDNDVDVIQIHGGETYNLTIAGAGEDDAFTGDLDILDNATPDVDIRVEAVGGTAVVQINGGDRVWHVHGAGFEMVNVITRGGDVDLGGGLYNDDGQVTVTGGAFSLNNAQTGAAINSSGDNAELHLTDVEVSRNEASAGGGGIANLGGIMVLIDSTITGNTSFGTGGGLSNNNASATLTRTTVSSNVAGGCGGGIRNTGTGVMTLIDSRVINTNTTDGPGGGICNQATLSVTQGSVISGNEANTGGGGIYSAGTLNVFNSTVQDNVALDNDNDNDGFGGGIYTLAGSSTIVRESAIIGNNAATSGGGIAVGGQMLVFNSTISDNFGITVGGIFVSSNGSLGLYNATVADNGVFLGTFGIELHVLNGDATLGNSIVANSTQAFAACTNASGTIASIGYNLSDDDTCFNEMTDLVNVDPLLAPLADGARTPQVGSPVVDAAEPTICTETAVGSTDQLGTPRPIFNGCDIGAVEWQGLNVHLPVIVR